MAVRALFRRNRPLPEVGATVAAYQFASASASAAAIADMANAPAPLTIPQTFTGVSSHGFPVLEPIIATIDRHIPAPAEPLPANWWTDADAFMAERVQSFMAEIDQLVAAEVRDAGRSASQTEFVARPTWTNYVRVLNLPSCERCAVLAERVYRDLEAFSRHPSCDCVMVPVTSWEAAHEQGYVFSAQDAFDKGQIRGLSQADTQAIKDGGDIRAVVNAHRGMTTPTVFGHKVKATTEGTTKRAAWRKANPTRLVRLRPESIYEIAESRADAIRLLKLYGYITP